MNTGCPPPIGIRGMAALAHPRAGAVSLAAAMGRLPARGCCALMVPMPARPRRRVSPRSATAIDAYIGAQIRKRRLALKMSQADIAKTLGISTQQVQKYEAGQNRVSAARLFDICRVLKVSLSSMFERNPKA